MVCPSRVHQMYLTLAAKTTMGVKFGNGKFLEFRPRGLGRSSINAAPGDHPVLFLATIRYDPEG